MVCAPETTAKSTTRDITLELEFLLADMNTAQNLPTPISKNDGHFPHNESPSDTSESLIRRASYRLPIDQNQSADTARKVDLPNPSYGYRLCTQLVERTQAKKRRANATITQFKPPSHRRTTDLIPPRLQIHLLAGC